MSDYPFIGEINILPYNYAPRNFTWCEGQLMPIAQNSALFALMGSTYGGDWRVTMGVPNLKGRTPIGEGTGPGLSLQQRGQASGLAAVVLQTDELPAHIHELTGVIETGPSSDVENPAVTYGLAQSDSNAGRNIYMYRKDGVLDEEMATDAVSYSGLNEAHQNRQPYLALHFCLALDGAYPPRS